MLFACKVPSTTMKTFDASQQHSELDHELNGNGQSLSTSPERSQQPIANQVLQNVTHQVCNEAMPEFDVLEENLLLFERKKSKSKRETKKLVCDCILTKDERSKGIMGCGDDCLNRMLMIECGSRCPLEDHCSNKRFNKKQYAKVEPFKTQKKGWGLRALESIPPHTFIMEYVGEVIDPFEFHKRVEKYAKQKLEHHYFMALRADEIIDATCKGNVTRFINHSCAPNSQTQKWTINGELRIGFFTFKQVIAGEEITFDYQFQRYGKKAQKCYCCSENCRGFIGGENANILTDGSKIPKKRKNKVVEVVEEEEEEEEAEEEEEEAINEEEDEDEDEEEFLGDIALEQEINALVSRGLRNREQMQHAARLMIQAEKRHLQMRLIEAIMSTVELANLRLFLDYHGLKILKLWMHRADGSADPDDINLKARILELLEILPIRNKTILTDNKILELVTKWAHKDSFERVQYLDIAVNDSSNCKEEMSECYAESSRELGEKSEPIDACDNNMVNPLSTPPVDEPVETDKNNSKSDSILVNDDAIEAALPQASPTAEENSTELTLSSGVIVIKSKLQVSSEMEPLLKKSNISVGYLAQKLLIHWKDLKEFFRIPRLERHNRQLDEEEVDRKAKEDEERQAQGLPASVPFDKRLEEADREYSIAGILGNKRRCLKSLTEVDRDIKRIPISSATNSNAPQFFINPNQNSIASKLTKEEHRRLFEFKHQQFDYMQAMKKYREDLAIYQATYRNPFAQQMNQQILIQQLQAILQAEPSKKPDEVLQQFRLFGLGNTNANLSSTLPISGPPVNVNGPPSLSPISAHLPNIVSNGCSLLNGEATQPLTKQMDHLNHTEVEEDYNLELTLNDLAPKYSSPLIHLTGLPDSTSQAESNLNGNNIKVSSYAIDNVAFDDVRYNSDDLIESMDKKTFDEIYPPAGIFYITKSETYFMSLPNEHGQSISVKENVTEPLSLSFTKPESSQVVLSSSWKCALFQGQTYYYNNRKQIKQWHPPQESQMDSYDDVINDSHFMSTLSSPLRHSKDADSPDDALEEQRELARKKFRNQVSQFVVKCLNPYMRSGGGESRITSKQSFKRIAQKITRTVVEKESKQIRRVEDLDFTDSVKSKTKEFVKKYMAGKSYVKQSRVYHLDSSLDITE